MKPEQLKAQMATALSGISAATDTRYRRDREVDPFNRQAICDQIARAVRVFDIDTDKEGNLPRGYQMYTTSSKGVVEHRFFRGPTADPITDAQWALDMATGWLDEFRDMLDQLNEPVPEAPTEAG